MNGDPVAYFITFTVYGTFLQGDRRWWHSRQGGNKKPQPRLETWHRNRLKFPVMLLEKEQRQAVQNEIARLCEFRAWQLWVANARSNHVHLVIGASNHNGAQIRDQAKANCTRVLRERWPCFLNRPVWTVGGDWQCVNSEDELVNVVAYTSEGQDRKGIQ